jgi:lysophospholipase L1-like esterase
MVGACTTTAGTSRAAPPASLAAAPPASLAAAPPASLAAAPPASLAADPCAIPAVSEYLAADATNERGVIRLLFFDAEGSPVDYSECVGGRPRRIGQAISAPNTMTILATPWSCTRVVRRFVAATTLPSGTRALGSYSVRTPSCSHRFELSVPRRVKPGSTGRIRVVDGWGTGGIRPQLCITPPAAKRSCRTLAFPRAVAFVGHRFRATTRGRWRIELRVRDRRIRTATVAVGGEAFTPARALPTLLATGDSTMQGIDSFLADDLGDAVDVRSDVRPGTGISKLNPWARIAARAARSLRPQVTVISIGANDVWPMTTAAGVEQVCCEGPWIAEYALRVRSMMHIYLRRGRGRVLWLTLPVPRDPRRVPIFAAVNQAVQVAASGVARVMVMRMDELFSPHGYQETIRYRGHDINVREPDGIHLNVSGTAIAATAIVQALRQRP